jgi:hypothetical protein
MAPSMTPTRASRHYDLGEVGEAHLTDGHRTDHRSGGLRAGVPSGANQERHEQCQSDGLLQGALKELQHVDGQCGCGYQDQQPQGAHPSQTEGRHR